LSSENRTNLVKTQTPLARRLSNFYLDDFSEINETFIKQQEKQKTKELENDDWKNETFTKEEKTKEHKELEECFNLEKLIIWFSIVGVIVAVSSLSSPVIFLVVIFITGGVTYTLGTQKKKKLKNLKRKYNLKDRKKLKAILDNLRQDYESKNNKRLHDYNQNVAKEKKRIQESIEKEKKRVQESNEEKMKIWSHLYYCHRCDHVIDLETKLFTQPESINELITEVQKSKNAEIEGED